MDSAPSIETVLQALQALYKSTPGDTGSHEKASQWLGDMQKSVYAWQIADQLIQMNKDEESCYFGAQTIRTKIQFAFHELPPESHQSLRDSLLKHCTKINDETKNTIVTQLSLSLSDLVVQMATWKNAIADLMHEFGSSRTHWAFLLEFLSVLPEEINSRHLRLGDNRRNEVFDEMTNASPMLVQLLTAVMEAALDDSKTKERVMHCLGSWLSVYAIPQQHLIGSKLLHLPFAIMANHETPLILHNAATECICSALIAVEDLSKNYHLAQMLYEGVTSLLEPYHMSVAIQDLEKSMNYCRIFTEMAETFLEAMIATPNQGFGDLRTLELLLTCIGHHHFEVADITFNFWNRLSEVLYDENKPEIIAVFQPYVQRLVIALCRLCQYESSQDGLPDEADDFDDFRVRSVDLVKDVEFIVGAANIIVQMFETLKGSGSGTPWQVAEAAIFIMAAVAKYIDLTEESAVPQVIQGITGQQPGTHLAVLHSSMKLIGEFSKWINVHPQLLEPSMQFLLNGLHHSKLSTIAAESIQKLCSVCAEHMVAQFSGLLLVVQAIDTLNVTLSAGLGLLKACSLILARLSFADIAEGVRQLCILQVEPLNKIISLGDVRVNRDEKQTDPSVWLDRLSVIFRHTTPSVPEGKVHPCQDAIQQVWPVLSRCFQKYGGDIRIIERCCRCVRYAVRCLGKKSTVLLNPVLSQIVEQYQHHPHSCYLYLGSVLVDEYGLEPTCISPMLNMLQALSTPTFKMLEEQDGLRNHPDTVDDLFRLTTRFIQTNPVAFLQSPIARSIFLCGIASVSIHHRDANESVTKYFLEFIRCTREKPDNEDFATRRMLVVDLLKEYGQALIHALLKASLFDLPRPMIPNSAEIIYELHLVDSPSVGQWLQYELQALPTHSPGGAINATPQQMADFHASVTSAEKLKGVVNALREFSRLYR